jgi:hypothetical protein
VTTEAASSVAELTFFQRLTASELEHLVGQLEHRSIAAGSMVVRAGDQGEEAAEGALDRLRQLFPWVS